MVGAAALQEAEEKCRRRVAEVERVCAEEVRALRQQVSVVN